MYIVEWSRSRIMHAETEARPTDRPTDRSVGRSDGRLKLTSSYGDHSPYKFLKIAPLPSKITYIKMDPLNPIRNGFANGPIVISVSHGVERVHFQ